MPGGFNNPLVSDGGGLAYPSVHSPNYVPGVSGWTINKDGSAEFRSIVVAPGTSITIFVQGTTPTANAIGDLWYDTSNGMLFHQWNGTTWGPFSISTGGIGAGAITAALIAANTITAAQIAAGTITAAQIAANTITASQIAANTISAAQLSAGIVYAGIVDGTTISGAQFIAHGSAGELLVYNGTPANGNLIASISAVATTDAFGNTVQGPGFFYYSLSGDGGYIGMTKTNTGQIIINIGNTAHSGTNAAFIELTADTINFGWSGIGSQISLAASAGGNPGYTTIDSPLFSNNGTPAFPTFITTDSWHNTGAMTASWGKGTGFFKYKLLPGDGMVMVAAQGLVPGTVADGTTILTAANGLPAGYRPSTNKPVVADTNYLKTAPVGTGSFENARLNFNSDGSVQCSGFGTAATFCNCYGTFPLDI